MTATVSGSASSNVGYGAQTTSTSGAIVQNYVDVPQTVNVVTSEFMQDLNLDNSRLALDYVPGVFTFSSINPGSYFIRGSSVGASYIDGMVLSGSSPGSHSMDAGCRVPSSSTRASQRIRASRRP